MALSIPGGCGTPSHCQYWSNGNGQNIACKDCGRFAPTAGVGYYFCPQCYVKSCTSCGSLKLQAGGATSGSPFYDDSDDDDGEKNIPVLTAAQVKSMAKTMPGGCGTPSHKQTYGVNGDGASVACDDCGRQVPGKADVGYFYCNQCYVSSCVSCTSLKQKKTVHSAAQSSRASPGIATQKNSYNKGNISDDDSDDDSEVDDGEKNSGTPTSLESLAGNPIPGGCGTPSHCQYWSTGNGKNISCKDCGRYVPTAGVGYYFCSECYAKSCTSCASLKLQAADAKEQPRSRGSPFYDDSDDDGEKKIPVVTAAQVESMAKSMPGGCGTPSHNQTYGFNGEGATVACDDCGRQVPGKADVGYYFCNQCYFSSCVGCTSLKQKKTVNAAAQSSGESMEETPIPGGCGTPSHCQYWSRGTGQTIACQDCGRFAPTAGAGYYFCSECYAKSCMRCASVKLQTTTAAAQPVDYSTSPATPSGESMEETPIPGGCGTLSHCQYWSRGTGQKIACQDCGRFAPTAGVGYYFCSQCYAKSCTSCAAVKLQAADAKKQSRSRGRAQQQTTSAAAQGSRGLSQQTVNAAAQSSRTSPASKVNNNPVVTPSVESMGRAIRGGCGMPSHVQRYLCNGRTIACEDCSRQVPTVGVGYYFCNQCEASSCMSCTFNKQGQQGSTSNAEPAPASRASPLLALQASDDDDDDDDVEEPILPCAGLFTHKLEFLQKSPYYGNSFGCNMCGEAGHGELYHCESCQFDAHKQCADVEEEIKVFYHKHTLQRYYTGDDDDDEDIMCQCCQGEVEEDVSSWVYKCPECDDFAVHARCAKYAKSLTHGSHPHKLKLVHKSSKGKSRQCGCDACAGEILHTYYYTCTKGGCDFDLHPLCAVLPSKPLCRKDPSHRVEIDYFPLASEQCVLCDSPSDEAWLYRCSVCDVSMHVDCFGAETDGDSSDEEEDEEEEEEDLGELYQKFIESMDDFGNPGDEEKVDKLSELVDNYKSSSEATAASSFARQNSVKSRVQPKVSSLAQSDTHILDQGFANMFLGDAAEEERRRIKEAAKEQRRKEKAAEKEMLEQDKAARREEKAKRDAEVYAQLQNLANKSLGDCTPPRHQRDSSSPPFFPEDSPQSTYSPGVDSPLTRSSESDVREAAEEERRRVKWAAKEQRQKEKAAEKEQEKQEKAARRAEKAALREERAQKEATRFAQLQNLAMELQKIQLSGGNDARVAELRAITGNWQAQFARQHEEEAKRNEDRHLEQNKRNEERHLETIKLHHDQGKLHHERHLEQTKLQLDQAKLNEERDLIQAKLNQERHLHSTKLHREQLELQKEQAKLQGKRHLEHTNLLQQQKQEYLNGLQEVIRTQVQSTTRVVPRLVLCTETKSKMKKLLTSLPVGIKDVQLHLFCEHDQQPHVVAGAPGCEINQKVAGDRWRNIQPFLAAGLRVLTMALHMGTSMGTGVGFLKDVVPDLHKIVQDTLVLDLGKHGLQTTRGGIVPVPRPEEEAAAAQWLVLYLRDQKVNIGDCFKLHRVRFKAPEHIKGNVGWLCSNHLEAGRKAGSLEHFPL